LPVEPAVEGPADRVGQPGNGHDLFFGEGPQFLDRAELLEQAGPPGRAQTGHVVELRASHLLVTKLAVVRDREAMGLVSHLLEKIERF
jgi:hypothetical protein